MSETEREGEGRRRRRKRERKRRRDPRRRERRERERDFDRKDEVMEYGQETDFLLTPHPGAGVLSPSSRRGMR